MAGLRVVRGPDWNLGDSDGGEGHLGTVVEVREREGTASVVWDIGNTTTCRIGKDQQHDLIVLDNAPIGKKRSTEASARSRTDNKISIIKLACNVKFFKLPSCSYRSFSLSSLSLMGILLSILFSFI